MISRVIEASARNRLLVFCAVTVAFVAGVWSMRHVKLDAVPDLSDPQVIVFTEWMGRSPTLVEDQVTYPIVSGLISASKVSDVRGYSMFGMSFVYVIFEEGTDPSWARSRVLEHLSSLQGRLPPGVAPTLGPDASGVGWVFQYVLVDKTGKHGLDALRTFQDFTLRYALGTVRGVAEVASVGGYQKQYQVTVDPNRLRANGVTLQEVIGRLRDSNEDVGGRVIELSEREYSVRGRGTVQAPADLEKVVLRADGPNGSPLLLRDVGQVRFGPEIRRGLLDWNGEGEAVGGIVVMRQGENALEVIERVKARVAELKPGLPDGVTLEVAYDRSSLIERAIATLATALGEEALVVALVMLLFLLHFRSALLPTLSIPVAVAVSFVPMYLLGIPATIMSLGGIAIAIGATVDAEIVMIEASHKKLEFAPPGADRRRLLAEAAREVTPALFFSLLIIAVAFLPVFTLTGQAGRLFTPLAWTKTFVMLSAAALSITFAPALRDLLLRGKLKPEATHPVSRFIIRVYKPFVYVALRSPRSTVAIGLLAVLSAVPLSWKLGSEFMPPLDEGDVLSMPTTFPGISIEEARRSLQQQDQLLRSVPEVATVFGKVGRAETATDPAPLTMIETTVQLKPRAQWRHGLTREALVEELNAKLQVPGWTNAFTMPIKGRMDMLSTGVRTAVGVKVMAKSVAEIEALGVALEGLLRPLQGTRSVFYERNTGGLYLDVVPDRDALARYGLTVGDVARVVEAAIGGAPIGVAVEGRNRFSINVRYPQDVRSDVEQVRRILVPLGGGGRGLATSLSPPTATALPSANVGPAMNTMGAPTAGSPGPQKASTGNPLGLSASNAVASGSADLPSGWGPPDGAFVPLGEVAEVKLASGPPMVRDDGGQLVGFVYVDLDDAVRDVGTYVGEARALVAQAQRDGRLIMPTGAQLKWTGQYELMEQMEERMKLVIPLTLLLIVLLLYVHFRNLTEVLIVLLSVPFAMVGSVWLMWALDYHLSTAVWVGLIALVGLAAQTGIVMIVYIDHAYERRRAAGKIRDLSDIIWAHMDGTVQRVRPKLMTVATMLAGLLPLLWATGSGADVMKRIAAPMVGGLLTSAFLTLEIIPVIYTYWRYEQLLWERLAPLDGALLEKLTRLATVQKAGWLAVAGAAVAGVYLPAPLWLFWLAAGVALVVALGALAQYLPARGLAKKQVWGA